MIRAFGGFDVRYDSHSKEMFWGALCHYIFAEQVRFP